MLGQKSFQDKRYSRYKVLQGHRAKVNLFQRLLKDSGQKLLEVKGSSRSSVDDSRQRILKIKGYLRSKDRCSSMAKAPHSHMTKVTLG